MAISLLMALLLAGPSTAQDDAVVPVQDAGAIAAREPAAQGRKVAARGWLAAALGLGLLITVVLAVGAWLVLRPSAGTRGRRLPIALAAIFVLVGAAACWFYFTSVRVDPPADLLDQVIGLHETPGIEEDGFLGTELSTASGESYRWTTGAARLVVPLGARKPTAMFIRLGSALPRPAHLEIKVNGQRLFEGDVAMPLDWPRNFEFAGLSLGREMVIEIVSDTFVPAELKAGVTDRRTLGLCLRGITLVSGMKEFTNVPLGVRALPEVSEEGFYAAELDQGEPVRWTNGAAKLTVPIRGTPPRALALTLSTLRDAAKDGYRIKVGVNGQTLFDEDVKAKSRWSAELPLEGIALGDRAVIEVTGSTSVPAKSDKRSQDERKLGVRVRRLMLVND